MSRTAWKLYEEHQNGECSPNTKALVQLLIAENLTYDKTLITVDALDEVTENFRMGFLDIIQSLDVSLLVLSRYSPDIERAIQWPIRVNITTSSNDLGKFIDAHLSNNSSLSRLLARDPSLQGPLMQRIEEQSQGV